MNHEHSNLSLDFQKTSTHPTVRTSAQNSLWVTSSSSSPPLKYLQDEGWGASAYSMARGRNWALRSGEGTLLRGLRGLRPPVLEGLLPSRRCSFGNGIARSMTGMLLYLPAVAAAESWEPAANGYGEISERKPLLLLLLLLWASCEGYTS